MARRTRAPAAGAEREIDDLYGLPLEEFTAARNALAARLKREGEDEAAAAVKALRKPTVPAAVLNQLARREPELVAALLDAGQRLRAAQQRALAGREADDLRRATAAEREAVRALAAAAGRLGGRKLTQPVLDRVRASLAAVTADEEAGELLRRGRVAEEFEPSGFGGLSAVAPAAKRGRRGADEAAAERARRERERERTRALRARLLDLRRAARDADRTAERARAEADEAARRAAELAAQVERLEAELSGDADG